MWPWNQWNRMHMHWNSNQQVSLLFGLFYRPPNSSAEVYSNVDKSISLAVDTGTSDIIITDDFNFNVLNSLTQKKIDSLCTQFSLRQPLIVPSHFTEHSSSLIDILVSNKEHIILHGVGLAAARSLSHYGFFASFLNQRLRPSQYIFGCIMMGILGSRVIRLLLLIGTH